jgi:tRNA modification GTPase
LDVLPRILLFGPPNSGKSSLMNQLSGTSRAICAAAAGTTRDVLSAPIRLGRGEAILLDTAGVDRSEDEIVAQARAMTLSTAERVDLICVVVDVTAKDDEHLWSTVRELDVPAVVVAANKSDLLEHSRISHGGTPLPSPLAKGGKRGVERYTESEPALAARQMEEVVNRLKGREIGPVCVTSAKDGSGIDTLRAAFAGVLGTAGTTTLGEAVVLSERQRQAIRSGSDAIQRAITLSEGAAETIDCADLVAFELREALDTLGSVTGEVTTEDLLGQVFANFCIGK